MTMLMRQANAATRTGLTAGAGSRARAPHAAWKDGSTAHVPAVRLPLQARMSLQGKALVSMLALAALLLALPVAAALPTPPGTTIANTATVNWTAGSTPVVTPSNTESHLTTEINTTLAVIRFLQHAPTAATPELMTAGPTQCYLGGVPMALPDPTLFGGGTLDVDVDQPFVQADVYHQGEPVFVTVADADHNTHPGTRDSVLVTLTVAATGDSETLELLETGVNTGVFTGFVPSSAAAATPNDCVLGVETDSQIVATYTDFTGLVSTVSALVDPFGFVYDSISGALLDGATVTLIDANTGLPATVFGDDGVSIYPSTVVTGSTVMDSGSNTYVLGQGQFRFPFVSPGNYRFVVTPPAGYTFPSIVPTPSLPPGFVTAVGSRGEVFVVLPGPALRIDVPVDAASGGGLLVNKTTSAEIVATGDLFEWRVTVTNTSVAAPATVVVTTDTLPVGLRYRAGSARQDGVTIADPTISPDGRTLTFALGTIAPAASTLISYVTEVGAGTHGRVLRNNAQATGAGGLVSNVAQASVELREDLFGDRATLVGEVLEDSCDAARATGQGAGVPGVRVLLEDGSYAITDERGRYHFRGVSAGTHVVQLDVATLPKGYEVAECLQNTRFAGRSYSQFAELQRGSLWRADFRLKRLAPSKGLVRTQLKATSIAAERGVALFEFQLSGQAVPLSNLRASFLLPDGAELVPGSVVLDGAAVPGAEATDGVMTLRLGDRPAAFAQKIAFRLKLPIGVNHEVSGILTVDGPAKKNLRVAPVKVGLTLAAEDVDLVAGSVLFTPRFQSRGFALNAADRAELRKVVDKVRGMESVRFHVVGFTDAREVIDQPFDDLRDNDDLSKRRADAVADFLAAEAGIARSRIVIEGRGSREPVGDNKLFEGMALNRRVIISMIGASDATQGASQSESPTAELEVEGLRPGAPSAAAVAASAAAAAPVDKNYAPYAKPVDGKLLAGLAPGARDFLWPATDVNPPIPSVKLAVQHRKGESVELKLNGIPVPRTSIQGVRESETSDVAVTEWGGVDLADGDNRFEAVVRDAAGLPVATLARGIYYAGRAVRAELLLDRSTLVADGVSKPTIAVRFLDRSGRPVHAGSSGEYEVAAPYQPWRDIDDRYTDKLFVGGNVRTGWTAGEDGIALIELAPTTDAGEALLTLQFHEKLTQDLRVWLEPAARDWVLVGLAEGSLGHNTVSGNAADFAAAGGAPDYYEDGRIAFYAKGMVKGEYLLTVAYDTSKDSQLGGANLEQQIDPNAYYLLYGDATEQRADAASISNLYVRIERKQFYAMFGDMDTGLTLTELGRYSRRLNGLKSEYRGERFAYSAFAAEDRSAFVKDEIPGDGTSGLYRLTQRPLLINSEQVRIQVRDRFHSETILSEQVLQRYTDYTIDYTAGTLFMRRPVPSHDASFNQVFIVVDYEVQGVAQGTVTAGGRGALLLNDGKVEIGATLISEGVTGAEGELGAADLRVKIGAATTLEAEVATSESQAGAITSDGNAFKVEVEHVGETVVGRVYARQQDEGFGLGQQSGGESGTRKVGVEGTVKIDAQMDVSGQVYQQDVLATGAQRQVAEAALRYTSQDQDYTATGGLRHANDSGLGPTDMTSDQVFVGGTARVTNDLTLRAQGEASVSGDSANVDFPDRLMVGADYKLSAKANAFIEHEIAQGPAQDSDMTRVGVRTQPWERGRVDAAMEQQYSENGPRLFATLGVGQGWQATEDLLFDFGVDRVQTIRSPGNPLFNPNVPPASGSAGATGDFTAYYVGATWRQEDWTVNGRVETLSGDTEDRLGFTAGAYRAQGEKMGLAFRLTYRDSEFLSGDFSTEAVMSFGFAWRPTNPAFIWLDRVDLVYDDDFTALGGASTSYKLINNLNLNHRPDSRWETSYQYAFKYQRAEFGTEFTSFTDLIGVDSRYDLNSKWDVGGQVYALHSWSADTYEYTAGLSVGHSFAKNVWLSIGYNFAGFEDEDFAQARYTAQGPYIQFRVKFDQDTWKDLKDYSSGNPVNVAPGATK